MNKMMAEKIRNVVEGNARSREIMGNFCLKNKNGCDPRENQEGAVNYSIPNFILTTYNNPMVNVLKAIAEDIGKDPVKDLVSDLEQIQKILKPILTEGQDNTLTCACETIDFFYDLAENTKLMLAVMYIQGYVQVPE